jgi:hypothetical protein
VSDTALLAARERTGLSRERVVRQMRPPISSKTLERWEKTGIPDRSKWMLPQLADIYGVPVDSLNGRVAA